MSEIEFYRPKAEWGEGPWQHEPDEDQGAIETPYITLKARLMRNASGAWCGYVGVPPGHHLHGKHYRDREIEDDYHSSLEGKLQVHGGLTFSGPRVAGDDWWYFGFDCSHAWDYSPGLSDRQRFTEEIYRTIEFVRQQCDGLGQQIAELEKKQIARYVEALVEKK